MTNISKLNKLWILWCNVISQPEMSSTGRPPQNLLSVPTWGWKQQKFAPAGGEINLAVYHIRRWQEGCQKLPSISEDLLFWSQRPFNGILPLSRKLPLVFGTNMTNFTMSSPVEKTVFLVTVQPSNLTGLIFSDMHLNTKQQTFWPCIYRTDTFI